MQLGCDKNLRIATQIKGEIITGKEQYKIGMSYFIRDLRRFSRDDLMLRAYEL